VATENRLEVRERIHGRAIVRLEALAAGIKQTPWWCAGFLCAAVQAGDPRGSLA
jgi:hypothetical protein